MVGIWREGERNYDEPAHVAIQLPNGELLDIQGLGVECRWDVDRLKRVGEKRVRGFDYYVKPNVKAAMPFAKNLVKQYSKEINEATQQKSTPRSKEVVPTQDSLYETFYK